MTTPRLIPFRVFPLFFVVLPVCAFLRLRTKRLVAGGQGYHRRSAGGAPGQQAQHHHPAEDAISAGYGQ